MYPSDLKDEQWDLIKDLLPQSKSLGPQGGRPSADLRMIVNGMLYVLKTGCQWRFLPKEYGPWSTVYDYFREWRKANVWDNLLTVLRMKCREQSGKEASPTAAILDSQTVKTSLKGGHEAMMRVKRLKEEKDISSLIP